MFSEFSKGGCRRDSDDESHLDVGVGVGVGVGDVSTEKNRFGDNFFCQGILMRSREKSKMRRKQSNLKKKSLKTSFGFF